MSLIGLRFSSWDVEMNFSQFLIRCVRIYKSWELYLSGWILGQRVELLMCFWLKSVQWQLPSLLLINLIEVQEKLQINPYFK